MSKLQICVDIIINDDIITKQTFQYKLIENYEIMNIVKASVFKNGEYKIKDIKITSIKIIPKRISCPGCQTDQPGQLAHMDPGGCLYDASARDNTINLL